jgi:hypothetical protein
MSIGILATLCFSSLNSEPRHLHDEASNPLSMANKAMKIGQRSAILATAQLSFRGCRLLCSATLLTGVHAVFSGCVHQRHRQVARSRFSLLMSGVRIRGLQRRDYPEIVCNFNANQFPSGEV